MKIIYVLALLALASCGTPQAPMAVIPTVHTQSVIGPITLGEVRK